MDEAPGGPVEDPEVRMGAAELRTRLEQLPTDRRRALVAAVRAGKPAPQRTDAILAIALARRAQRNAQRGWFVFPLGGMVLLLLGIIGTAGVIVGSIIGAYLSTLLLARAVRAERLNRGLLLDVQPDGDADGPEAGERTRRGRGDGTGTTGRLPVRRRPPTGRTDGGSD
jgi:hypothetical protein